MKKLLDGSLVVESTKDLMKMNRCLVFYVRVMSISLILVSSLIYIVWSRDNPLFIELIFGVTALGIVIGILSSVVYGYFQGQRTNKALLVVAGCSWAFFLALLFFASNTPEDLNREISVTYLVNPSTGELPTLFLNLGQIDYLDVVRIFKQFGERSPEKAKDLLGENKVSSMRIFRDLTEYLIPYFIGTNPMTREAEPALYKSETVRKWYGKPHPDITDQPKSMDDISGPFTENLFYGIKSFPDTKTEIYLPKDTEITLERENDFVTTIVLKNKFQEISIGIQLLGMSSGGGAYFAAAVLPPPPLLSPQAVDELTVLYRSYETIIHFDATFSRFWYGHPDMEYYKEWAESLLSLLERKFRWGSPKLYNLNDSFLR